MKIVYFTEGPETLASSRLRCYRPGRALAQAGHDVQFNPERISGVDVIIIQKRAWERFGRRGIETLKQVGARIVWDVDDLYVWNDPPTDLVDLVTVDTAAKLKVYPGAVVVPDCLDVDDDAPRKTQHSEWLRSIVWFGGGDNAYHARNAIEAANQLHLEMTLITNLAGSSLNVGYYDNVHGVQWDVSNIDAAIIAADLVVCPYVFNGPQPREWIEAKSANRVYKAWGLGMPVAGTPIPSYIEAGLNYQGETIDEWRALYTVLAGRQAREYAAEQGYALAQTQRADVIKDAWLRAFEVVYER